MGRALTVLKQASFLVFFFCVVAAASASAGKAADRPAKPGVSYGGGSGESLEKAVVIRGATDSVVGIAAEYRYLSQRFGQEDLDWQVLKQQVRQVGNKVFDVITLEQTDGSKRTIYFDITGFFGKL